MAGATEPFEVDLPPSRVVFGAGVLDRVADEVERAVTTFREVRQHVPDDLASAAVDAARSADVDGAVSVGGGSAIGLGKVVAVELGIPLVAVPTTYSGSEMTPVYGTTGERKVTRRDIRALPRVAIYDPTLTIDLPPRVTATSGLNALAHCMEAIVGPGATPPSALAAREAASILPDALRACVRDGTDLDARTTAQYGGLLAGRAVALAGTGLQHKLAHILGGRFGAVHAEVHAVLLPRVAAFHERGSPERMSAYATALGADAPASATLAELAADTGAPLTLEELGVPRTAIDVAIDDLDAAYDPVAIKALLENAFVPIIRQST